MSTVPELFGCMVFDDKVMRARLSADVYRSLRDTMNKGKKLDLSLANAVADAMCEWAVENGATHFTHWFQPLTGITAEKHDSFITPAPDSHVIMEFSGKNLITGEPDASSFPSGGLRATFEARGYTAWDPTSYAFIKEKTLCIPTAFCSYGGEALDKKTPLLRSMEALNKQAMRILKLFGHTDVKRVVTNVGPEQEYFLVDREMYLKRKDLISTGRTLFGARPPKGQAPAAHSLGANEAPPAVVSMFLGDELSAVLDALENDSPYAGTERHRMRLGADVLPRFNRDTTDRNRTSPFAFTGNKFEFRMVGSNDSISCANVMINGAVAESLRQFADVLENCEGDFDSCLHDLIRETIKKHKRILFNGNGYDDAWIREATEVRGLENLRTTPDALQMVLDPSNVEMLTSHRIYSETELHSRYEISMENYVRTVRIEALTMVDMARKEILPAVVRYCGDLSAALNAKKAAAPELACAYETKQIRRLSVLIDGIDDATEVLERSVLALEGDNTKQAFHIRDDVLCKMAELRALCDEAETMTAAGYWPFPTYGDLLFGV